MIQQIATAAGFPDRRALVPQAFKDAAACENLEPCIHFILFGECLGCNYYHPTGQDRLPRDQETRFLVPEVKVD